MLLRPDREDLRIIGYYVSKVLTGVGAVELLLALLALALAEWNSASALAVGAGIGLILGRLGELRLRTERSLDWSHGMVTVASAWLLGPALLAVPLFLSAHYGSYVDAYFDAMSGLTTSGLAVIQDLDHLPHSMNLFRHVMHFMGGQGIIVVVLTLLASSPGQVGTLYVGEARDEQILPNFIRTARFIYLVALVFGAVGTLALTVAGLVAGLRPARAIFHAASLFMAAFDTGGFSPQSTSMAYYHSVTMEAVVSVLMIAGSMSFGTHYLLWRGRARTALRHIEVKSLAITLAATSGLAMIGLATGPDVTFSEPIALFRKGFFTILSAHTGTGFAVNASRLYASDWGLVAPAALVGAMALGGMASSTAGGIKAIRVGLAGKALWKDIRRTVLPDAALNVSTYRSTRDNIVRDEVVRPALTILLLFLWTYLLGGMLGLYFGYPFEEALFESTSAAASVGLSIGIVSPDLELPLKLTYIAQMWAGRLEFTAVFVLFGYGFAFARGRTRARR